MTIHLSTGQQNPHIHSSTYDHFAPITSQASAKSLNPNEFGYVFEFLGPEDLGRSEKVCRHWALFINAKATDQWKRQCQIQLGILPKMDPKQYLPDPSYKKSFQLIFSGVFGESVYERYLGKAGPVPQIPKGFFLKGNEPDPCDPKKKIRDEYVLMYFPDYIKTTHLKGFFLNKPDDPTNLEALTLIEKEEGFVERYARTVTLGAKHENEVLEVAMTINNMKVLFEHPKTGHPSTYNCVWDKISEQHGNQRIPAGWIWMRRHAIGMNLSFLQQQALAKDKGVVIPSLQHRILFNLLEHVQTGIYPNGQGPWTYARTSTLIRDFQGNHWTSGCRTGGSFGLSVGYSISDSGCVGVAVAIPAEVQAIL